MASSSGVVTLSLAGAYLVVTQLKVQVFVLLVRSAAPVSAIYAVAAYEVESSSHHLPFLLSNNKQHLITHLLTQPAVTSHGRTGCWCAVIWTDAHGMGLTGISQADRQSGLSCPSLAWYQLDQHNVRTHVEGTLHVKEISLEVGAAPLLVYSRQVELMKCLPQL